MVCPDETSKQLIAETPVPIPAKPSMPERHDYEIEREGTANLFTMFAPLESSAVCRGGGSPHARRLGGSRNQNHAKNGLGFTTTDAPIKLNRRYQTL
jgi:hypothetical protein